MFRAGRRTQHTGSNSGTVSDDWVKLAPMLSPSPSCPLALSPFFFLSLPSFSPLVSPSPFLPRSLLFLCHSLPLSLSLPILSVALPLFSTFLLLLYLSSSPSFTLHSLIFSFSLSELFLFRSPFSLSGSLPPSLSSQFFPILFHLTLKQTLLLYSIHKAQ